MMPFLSPTPMTRIEKTHFNCLDWGVLELTFEEEGLLGVKNAKVATLWLLAYQNSLCLANTSHCCFPSMVFEFALAIMLTIGSLMDANPQKSPSNFGSMG
jgi:hypothetical protein